MLSFCRLLGAMIALFFGAMETPAQSKLRSGLQAEWNFDEKSGLAAADKAGPNQGALVNFAGNTAQWVAGKVGGAIAFDGSNYVEIPDHPSIGADLVNGFTVAAWFKSNNPLSATGATSRFLEKGDAYFFLQGVANGGMNFLVKKNNQNVTAGIQQALSANEWHHIAGAFDGSNIRVYLNGELKNTVAVAAPLDDDKLPLRIGADDSGRFFNGAVDQVLIWNRPLSAEEVVSVFKNELDVTPTDPPKITQAPKAQTLFAGGTLRLSVEATGARPMRFLWFKNDQPLRTATESSLVIEHATPADAGNYHVRVTNAGAEILSTPAKIDILPITGLETGRVAFWRLDETSGESAKDSSANANHFALFGFPAGAAAWAPGKVNRALDFTGEFTVARAPNSASLNSVGPEATIGFWIKPASYGPVEDAGTYTRSASYILRKGDHFHVRIIDDPGTIRKSVVVRSASGPLGAQVQLQGAVEVNSAQGSVEVDVWQHFAIVYRNNTISFYKNGFPIGDVRQGALGAAGQADLILGDLDELQTAARNYEGLLDELAIWARPLGEAELLEIAGKDVNGPPVIEIQPRPAKRLEGTTAEFSVIATGKRPVKYQWLRNDTPLEGATAPQLLLSSLKPGDAGNYSVSVSNDLGQAKSNPAELVVESLDAITSGLAAYYSFDDATGTRLLDSSGNELHGELQAITAEARAPGKIGGAFKLDGIDDFIIVPHNDLLSLREEGTIAVWINPVSVSNNGDFDRILRKSVNYDLTLLNNGALRLHGIDKQPFTAPANPVELEVWQHYAVVVRNRTIQWFKNGEPLSDPAPARLGEVNADPLVIGNFQTDLKIARLYEGFIDDLGIWNRALNSQEINGIFVNGSQGKPLTEEFEPLNIRTLAKRQNEIQLTFFNPFKDRTLVVQSQEALGGKWADLAGVSFKALTEGLHEASFAAPSPIAFYRVGALPPPPLFFDNFESGGKGWVHGGPGDLWELGKPVTGPRAAFSGENVYATGLSRNFGPFSDMRLTSPPVDLRGKTRATLRFWEFRNMDPPVNNFFVHGARINILNADNGAFLQELSTLGGTTSAWTERVARLGAESLDQRIVVEFQFFSDDFNPNEGWFIDDVTVTAE